MSPLIFANNRCVVFTNQKSRLVFYPPKSRLELKGLEASISWWEVTPRLAPPFAIGSVEANPFANGQSPYSASDAFFCWAAKIDDVCTHLVALICVARHMIFNHWISEGFEDFPPGFPAGFSSFYPVGESPGPRGIFGAPRRRFARSGTKDWSVAAYAGARCLGSGIGQVTSKIRWCLG